MQRGSGVMSKLTWGKGVKKMPELCGHLLWMVASCLW